MTREFEHFIEVIRHGVKGGELKLSNKDNNLTLLDLAIQWAVGKAQEDLNMFMFTEEDIYGLIKAYCGEDVFDNPDKICISW